MKNYVGIDLGTTNSAICSYDGARTRIWKHPQDQADVTPSVFFVDQRGNKYFGKRAYDNAPHSPDNAAQLFKPKLGTSTPVSLPAVDIVMTPEEASAEILRLLFGFLGEGIRNDPETGTVITVPAAFDQMQKTATSEAAQMAAIGRVVLMQEPVAAVMSVMRERETDGIFAIVDLGGGTLDVALAESVGGRVNLLSQGGKPVCGGRQLDRRLVDNVVKPWLLDHFDLPDDLATDQRFKTLYRLAHWAAEHAKIELSSREKSMIFLSEPDVRLRDRTGNDIYVEIPLERNTLDRLIEPQVDECISTIRETLAKSGIAPADVDSIVFIGGPTNYKPLRRRVALGLGVASVEGVNPMTAVAEGAAIFAESLDWDDPSGTSKKSSRGTLEFIGPVDVTYNFTARTPSRRAKVIAQVGGEPTPGTEFQIDSLDTGWTSGRIPLRNGATVDVALPKKGKHTFDIQVFDASGSPVTSDHQKIIINRTAATVDGNPASHSIGVEVLHKIGATATRIEWLVRKGELLPVSGTKTFTATVSVRARSTDLLAFQLWEGEEQTPDGNRAVGRLEITGSDFAEGVIPVGSDLSCDYEMSDSGVIKISVSVPRIRARFRSGNFYSPQADKINLITDASRVIDRAMPLLLAVNTIGRSINDPRIDIARSKLAAVTDLNPHHSDAEGTHEAWENVLEAGRLVARVKQDHRRTIRGEHFDDVVRDFSKVRKYARPNEVTSFDTLSAVAKRSIDRNDDDFDGHLRDLRSQWSVISWRDPQFVVAQFEIRAAAPQNYTDADRFNELVISGKRLLEKDDLRLEDLNGLISLLDEIRIERDIENDQTRLVNIVRRI